jgi:hypothetical protein
MSDDELAALAGPIGLGPDEKVPNRLRILAAQENLGKLLSVHRPVKLLSRLQNRGASVFVYDQGAIWAAHEGARTKLFLAGSMRIQNTGGRVFLLVGPQGQLGLVPAHWSDGEALGRVLGRWALAHPWR